MTASSKPGRRPSPDISYIPPTADCDRGYGRPSGRPRLSHLATYRSGTPQVQHPVVARWHAHLHGLATAIHEMSGLTRWESAMVSILESGAADGDRSICNYCRDDAITEVPVYLLNQAAIRFYSEFVSQPNDGFALGVGAQVDIGFTIALVPLQDCS